MDGFLIVNKPKGMTSMDVVSVLRKKLQTKKIGHTGTLDPMATGVLVLGIGRATKLLGYLENEVKTYKCEVLLGVETDTYDVTGTILEEHQVNININDIDETLFKMSKCQTQIPPMYSAIKVDGVKMYDLARQGKSIELAPRPIKIDYLKRTSELIDNSFSFDVTANKGFYVRSLVHDIGIDLGCHATMKSLQRIRAGKYTLEDSILLDDVDINTSKLIDIEDVYKDYPSYNCNDYMAKLIKNGVCLDERQIKTDKIFRVYHKGNLIALYEPIGNYKYKIIIYLGE